MTSEPEDLEQQKALDHIRDLLSTHWREAQDAADALGITAHRLKALGVVDKIVNEPVGGAHRDHKQMAAFLKRALTDAFRQVSDLKVGELLERRYERLQSYGRFTDTRVASR